MSFFTVKCFACTDCFHGEQVFIELALSTAEKPAARALAHGTCPCMLVKLSPLPRTDVSSQGLHGFFSSLSRA